ncbi:unnamed protein product [Litomosoides sigmodontis]|uniref:NADH dehydrogenase [ubiquinone] 1 beta subcomplex subunit 4 n=1 Tax=Litomosoides sigmodontis TaxID=42156 RepID=A0A3P6V603_LITSI|nr:unnamed protein product [Litomosoides sigmodontis]
MPTNTKLWQDPVLGYFETHGKMKFIAGEDYGISDEEKKAVLWRYRLKEVLKKEYLRREYDPHTFKYREGVVIDPAVFRWYSATTMQYEFFRYTPRSVFLYAGSFVFIFYILVRIMFQFEDAGRDMCLDGELLWWDRMYNRQSFGDYFRKMGTKAALKAIRQHIDAKEFNKARDIIEDLLEQDISDYLLFIFAAITHGEVGNGCEAVSYYKKAAELDPEKPLAWQGLYKLYEQGQYVDLEHVVVVIQNLLHIPELSSEKLHTYEKDLGYVLLKLKRFDDAFSNPTRINDIEFCYEALKAILLTDSPNSDQKNLIEQCLTRIDNDKLDYNTHKKCAMLRCSWAKLRQVSTSSDVVNMLKNATRKETEFEVLLEYIEKEEMPLTIKNIDESLKNNCCKWPYIGLATPLLLFQERYEQVLSLLDTTIPLIHPIIVKALSDKVFCVKCEALYSIHNDYALERLHLLLADCSDINRAPRNVRLGVMI